MRKGIEIADKIKKEPELNWLSELEYIDLHKTFSPLYNFDTSLKEQNLLTCFIIYGYDPDSLKLDVRKDRYENKVSIMNNIGININTNLIEEILNNSNEIFNNCVVLYLEQLTNWRWGTIFALLDYHSNMIRFCNQKTEAEKSIDKMNKEGEVKTLTTEFDIDVISKVNIQKSDLLKRAIESREQADRLLDDIRKEFMPTDHATQSDFGFNFTDTAKKKINIMSWRDFRKQSNEKKLLNQ